MTRQTNTGSTKGHDITIKISRYVAIVIATIIVAAGIYFVVGAYGLSDDMCGRTVIDEKVSPDGKTKAALVETSCGATTALSTRVLIAAVGSRFDDDRDLAARFKGQARRLEWDGAELRIFYDQAEPMTRPDAYRGTRLSYWRGD